MSLISFISSIMSWRSSCVSSIWSIFNFFVSAFSVFAASFMAATVVCVSLIESIANDVCSMLNACPAIWSRCCSYIFLRFSVSIARRLMFAAVGPFAFFNCSLYFLSSRSNFAIFSSIAWTRESMRPLASVSDGGGATSFFFPNIRFISARRSDARPSDEPTPAGPVRRSRTDVGDGSGKIWPQRTFPATDSRLRNPFVRFFVAALVPTN
mmetsp:Transcript_22538/g.58272  ORF Transcript_22538/g.58272 Transcript_22538/m.58272 type:complete len:210 (+) Transcript_22538:1269-1898(+)